MIMIIGNDDNDFSADDDDDDDFYVDEDDCRHWPYGKRSRYVVKPHLVDSLQVHYVNRSKCEIESNKFTRVFLKCHNDELGTSLVVR